DEDDDIYTEATPLARKGDDLEALWSLVKERWTGLSLEKSKVYTWSSKGQELEATGIIWCTYCNIFNHSADFVGRKKIPTLKVYTRSNAECSETSSEEESEMSLELLRFTRQQHQEGHRLMVEYILYQAQEQDFDQAS
nr:hypothetical protein [Tanacetum cinerariifolium]